MKVVIDKDLEELNKVFSNNSDYKISILPANEITNQNIKNSDALFLRSVTRINNALLENTKVKFIASLTSGEDHIDHEFLKEMSIQLSTGKGGNSLAVIEYTLSVISNLLMGNKIKPFESSIGIIGYGNIGKKLKSILDEINYPSFVFDPYEPKNSSSFEKVLACDVISIHCSYSKKGKYPSHHLLDKNIFSQLKDNQFLINTSRGEVLSDEFYFAKNKDNFAFDVWPNENEIDFTKLQKPYLATPHIAGKTIGAENNFTEKALKDFNVYFDKKLRTSDLFENINFIVDKSIEKEIDFFGIAPSLFLKIYDVKRDDLIFKKFFGTKQSNFSFQDLRTSLKRPGFNSHKLAGNLSFKTKSKLELIGFRL